MQKKLLSLLKSIEKNHKKYWNISPELGQFLNLLIINRNYKKVLEIGTSTGYSGIWLAQALSKTGGTLHTIESHKKERFNIGANNFKKSGLKNIVHILGHAPEDLPKIPKFFNMAFFDATKHEHPSYFKAIAPRIKKGGIIITDNIDSHKKALAEYTKVLKSQKNWHSQKLNIGTGILLSYKTSSSFTASP